MKPSDSRSYRRRDSHSPSSTTATPGRVRSASPIRSPVRNPSSSSGFVRGSNIGRNIIPPCNRCRSFKKKCSRTFPSCNLCSHAGQTCSYSAVPTTPEAEAVQLRARVQWLSDYVNRHLLPSNHRTSIEDVDTSADLASLLGRNSGFGPTQINANSTTSPQADGDSIDCRVSFQSSAVIHDPGGDDASAGTTARRFVDAYFCNVDRAYPLVNHTKVLENLESLGNLRQRLRDSQSTLLYLIMSMGCKTIERASQVPLQTAKRFEIAYAEIIQEASAGVSAYSIVGIAARQAIAIGLARRAAEDDCCTPAGTELRYRLYWSIFALDSMMAVSQGLPAALPDNADVPLPKLTVEEFASTERITYAKRLQTSRHVIQLRQLERRILEQVHLRSEAEITELAPTDRRATLSSLRASVKDWYSQGCLMSPMGGDNSTIHNSTTWLNARYYHLLVLLYYPNHFNSSAAAISNQNLQQFAQRQLQATSTLLQQQQLPLNCHTLFRLMPICLVLMYSFIGACHSPDWTTQTTFPFLAKDEAAQVIGQFSSVVSGGMSSFFLDKTAFPFGSARESGHIAVGSNPAGAGEAACNNKKALFGFIKSCTARLTSLMQELLGKSTCFQFIDYPFDNNNKLANDQTAPSPVPLDRDKMDSLQQFGIQNNTMIGYG
ncbi:hypothetical protein F5883DRAFT_634365 [Diaporthe sp. PMI_573]|nr:hypothetical protein F5883DRAFT_634365 [Diaporthaceae sp. PMI_573]